MVNVCLAKRKNMRVAQHFDWLRVEIFLCERTHTKAYIELFCQNKSRRQNDAKVPCKLVNMLNTDVQQCIIH